MYLNFTGRDCNLHTLKLYGTVHRKHNSKSVCGLALFVVIAPLIVNIIYYLLALNR